MRGRRPSPRGGPTEPRSTCRRKGADGGDFARHDEAAGRQHLRHLLAGGRAKSPRRQDRDATIGELRVEFERIQVAFASEAMNDAPPIYARHFTVAELKELAAFYRTPTGAKALREVPQVMGELTLFLLPRLQDVQRQTGEAFTRILREHGCGK